MKTLFHVAVKKTAIHSFLLNLRLVFTLLLIVVK